MKDKTIIDATGGVLGRIGSVAEKKMLKGEEVVILNCEKALISGDKNLVLKDAMRFRKMGGSGLKGPILPKSPDKFFKRKMRGMLPWKTSRGRELYRDLRCYVGIPKELEEHAKKAMKFETKQLEKYITVGQLCKLLG
jgi:large subunit ribosomal protein L13